MEAEAGDFASFEASLNYRVKKKSISKPKIKPKNKHQKESKSWSIVELAIRLCLLLMCLLLIKNQLKFLPTQLPKHELNKNNTNELAKVDGEEPMGTQQYTRN